ncbi:M1 family metallopeptidase [Streptomyces sp. PTM05]|uniref:Aminopeptidase N n=1 Tax=Streptantibioticus parmotrematis TaxID=2873249 RepID=A0ABS7QVF0_9ACTN|nr:M1 family metallopeptidase [Streptantibioticus parmotrematis]MBY8887182.1 M1 family metallopeptidase [Streptantibioticus parmotrematis]
MTRSAARRAAATATAFLAAAVLTAAQLPQPPQPGIGDRLYPKVGDPRYDVTAYDLTFDYRGAGRPLDAVTRIRARARTALTGFHLDFTRGTVRSVGVDGAPARFRLSGGRLLVTPAHRVPRGGPLDVIVRHTSDPGGPADDGGWVRTPDGLALADQAEAARRVFPCDDHPSDKARFTFHVTAPRGYTVVANGLPVGRPHATAGGVTWTYRTAHPMATELAQISIGHSAVLRATGPEGLPVRDVVGAADRIRLAARAALVPGQIAWMERQVGRYPFETYGILSVDTSTGFELETQTLSLFERRVLLAPASFAAPLMVHELSHQWFGDSVTPADWSDLWLNEGHATWYEWRYRAEVEHGPSLEQQARTAYRRDAANRADDGPPARPKRPGSGQLGIFRDNVYDGGGLVLYALHQEIGDRAFRALERAWVTRYRDANATTADLIALASRVSGRDLRGFLDPWLYGDRTPPMPGHPDWRTDPAR